MSRLEGQSGALQRLPFGLSLLWLVCMWIIYLK
jgi:hypothetical protein